MTSSSPLGGGTNLVGAILDGRFRLDSRIGDGAMGEVFRGVQISLNRPVAVKVLRAGVSDPVVLRRFEDEAKILSRLDHPGIVRVLDYGAHQDRPFLVMDLVEGKSLELMLAGGVGLPLEESVDVLVQICAAVGHAHEFGVIHRDLKPDNVIISSKGRVKVVDFGIARLMGVEDSNRTPLTAAGMVVGTPEYVSPEQAMGQPLDARSDLYSLGVLAYRMLSGRLPFKGDTPRKVLAQHAQEDPPPLVERISPTGREIAKVVHQLLAKRPSQRFPTAEAAAGALSLAWSLASSQDETGHGSSETESDPSTDEPSSSSEVPSSEAEETSSGLECRDASEPPAAGMRTANLTVVFVSMEDLAERMTRLSYQDQASLAAIFEALTVPVAKKHDGTKVKTIQESQLFTFSSPTSAMKAAAAMQDRAARYTREAAEDLAVRLRVGASSGEVRLFGADVYGEPVNLAARAKAMAGSGEVLLTGGVHLSMNRAEVATEPVGRRTFKGVPEPVDIYRLRRSPDSADAYGGMALDALGLPSLDERDARALASGWFSWRMHRLARLMERRRKSPEPKSPVPVAQKEATVKPEVEPTMRGEPSKDPMKAESAAGSFIRAIVGASAPLTKSAALKLRVLLSICRANPKPLGIGAAVLVLLLVVIVAFRGSDERPVRVEEEVRQEARASLPELERKVEEDPEDQALRAAYAHALASAGRREEAIGQYLRVTSTEPEAMAPAYIEDLVELLEIMGEATGDAETALLRVGALAVGPLTKIWEDEEAGRYHRRRAGQVLVALGEDVDLVPVWIATLGSNQCAARELAARELARLDDERAVPALRRASREGCWAGRRAARQALATLGH